MWDHIQQHRRLGWLAVALLMTAASACAYGGRVENTTHPDAPILLTVRNDNWYDMRVYELHESGSIGRRLATVPGLSSARVRLPTYLAHEGYFRVLLRPIGSTESFVTSAVAVRPGSGVHLRVFNNLRMSYIHLLSN